MGKNLFSDEALDAQLNEIQLKSLLARADNGDELAQKEYNDLIKKAHEDEEYHTELYLFYLREVNARESLEKWVEELSLEHILLRMSRWRLFQYAVHLFIFSIIACIKPLRQYALDKLGSMPWIRDLRKEKSDE